MNCSISQWIKIESSDKPLCHILLPKHNPMREGKRGKDKVTDEWCCWWVVVHVCFPDPRLGIVLCPWFHLLNPSPGSIGWQPPVVWGKHFWCQKCACSVKLWNTDGIWTQTSTKKVHPKFIKCLKISYWKGVCMWWIPHRSSFCPAVTHFRFFWYVLHLLLLVFVLSWKDKNNGWMLDQEYFEGFFSS